MALDKPLPQIAFIGRSNAGKSTLINTLTGQKGLAKTSAFPGRTQQLNIFLINGNAHWVDLPGYGFAKVSKTAQETIAYLIDWYFFQSDYRPAKVVLIIDANVGPTESDMAMFEALIERGHSVLVVANKIDKLKPSQAAKQLKAIQAQFPSHEILPFSSEKKVGISVVLGRVLG